STETTTARRSGGGGVGGGSSSSRAANNNYALKATTSGTKTDTSNTNKGDNNTSAVQPTFTAPNGVKIAPPTQAVYSKTFNDLAGRDWAASAINKLASLGIINGVAEGKFDPDAGSKRADFVIMLDKILGLSGYSSDNFDDVDSSKYYANYVGLAKQAGVATGYGDGNFGPENSLTRQDMMVLVAKTLEFCGEDISADTSVLDQFDDAAQMADYAKPFAAYLVSQGMVNGTGSSIEGTKDMTRAQMAVLMSKLYDKIYEIALANYNAEQAAIAEEAAEEESVEENTEETSETAEETTEAQ
ncbi:MAG: S-layer homology domain-containing protein, partial [Firmicutes bacterium]|nr:S-layer homology domain-containing protein [Bacillota bacterium]